LYELNADIIGLQEVVYGPEQLDELISPTKESSERISHKIRHALELELIGSCRR